MAFPPYVGVHVSILVRSGVKQLMAQLEIKLISHPPSGFLIGRIVGHKRVLCISERKAVRLSYSQCMDSTPQTHKRLVSGVGTHMDIKMGLLEETFPALR